MVKLLKVNPAALAEAKKGFEGVIADLGCASGVGGDYSSGLGRGFSGVGLSGGQVGHPGAKAALDKFTQRWEWGTRALVQKANQIADQLGMAGVGFIDQELAYLGAAAKRMLNNLGGDLTLPEEQIATMSWEELAEHNRKRLANRDWSAQSFKDLAPQMGQNLSQAGQNLRGLLAAAGGVPGDTGLPGMTVLASGHPGGGDASEPVAVPATE